MARFAVLESTEPSRTSFFHLNELLHVAGVQRGRVVRHAVVAGGSSCAVVVGHSAVEMSSGMR